jgi:thiamine-monophosphate kinase
LKSVEELGERAIINLVLKHLEPMPKMPVPFGDDVSAVEIGGRRLAVIKTDMLVGKTDVPPGMSLFQAARKAVVMNISDLAAKGVKPIALLTSIGIPRSLNRKDVERIGEGLNQGAREYDSYILGGDTNEASDLVISCAAFGIGEEGHLMLRSGAEVGDIVAVTGPFGNTASGLRTLLQSFSAPPEMRRRLEESVLMPCARLREGLALAGTGGVTASIDSSDGLAWCLHEISRASNVGFLIDRLPIAEEAGKFAEMHRINPIELCLYGGEEYELVVTIKRESWKKVLKKVPLVMIGRVTRDRSLILKIGMMAFPIEARGWEHFKTNIPKS